MKQFTLLLTLFVLSSFMACSTYYHKQQRACKQQLEAFVAEHWQFSHHDSIVIESDDMFAQATSSAYFQCMTGLTKKEIIQLFGKPHYQKENTDFLWIYYFTSLECYPFDPNRFRGYHFTFHKESGINIRFGKNMARYHQ